jgi:hypothetical protein
MNENSNKRTKQYERYSTHNRRNTPFYAIPETNETPVYHGTKKQFDDKHNENFSYVFLRQDDNNGEYIINSNEIKPGCSYTCQLKKKIKRNGKIQPDFNITSPRVIVDVNKKFELKIKIKTILHLNPRRTATFKAFLDVLEKNDI